MSTFYVNAAAFSHVIGLAQPKPSITQWQRLESDPSELDLAAGLDARLADPLWLIGRQWQFAELKAENAGMPVFAHLVGTSGALTLDGAGGDADALPEPAIEAEPARQVLPALAIEAALDLREALQDADAGEALEAVRAAFPLTVVADQADSAGRDFLLLLGDLSLDAVALAAALEAELESSGSLARVPTTIAVPGALRDQAREALEAWLADWMDLLVDPAQESHWQPARLEYYARLSAATESGTVPVEAPEYANGRFDWWAMDVVGMLSGQGSGNTVDETRIPVPIRFPGMPADRLFEFEPDGVSLLGADMGPTGVMSMLLIEYMVSASNDWYQIPLTLPYGTAFQTGTLTVTDSFGVVTNIGPATAQRDAWSMFEVSAGQFGDGFPPLFLLPAATANTLESEPIEEVALFRDEMANLAWAVERRLSGVTPSSYRPVGATPHGQALADVETTDASLIYRLQTPVPLNWYPLSPEPSSGAPGATMLRLRTLRRFEDGGPSEPGPHATVLRAAADEDLRIDEREIPRSGIVVTRSFQVARDAAGRRQVWLGRQKRTHRGEGASGRRTDLLDPLAE